MVAKLKKDMKYGTDGYVYVYRNIDGKKGRRIGIERYTKFSWDNFEHRKDRFIKANYFESLWFRLRFFLSGIKSTTYRADAIDIAKSISIGIAIIVIGGLILKFLI